MSEKPTGPTDNRQAALARAAELVDREDAAAREAIGRPVRHKRRAEIAVGILAVANVFAWLIFPPAGLDATDQRTPAAIERDLRITVATVASDMTAWQGEHGGMLPATLAEAGMTVDGVDYVRVDSTRFELRGADGTVTVSYDSRTPLPDFLAGQAGGRP